MTTTTKSRAAAAKVAEEARQGKSNIAGVIDLSEARQVTGLFFPNFGNGNYRLYLGRCSSALSRASLLEAFVGPRPNGA